MFARFFIDRPIFAWVISIVIVLAGLLAIALLPVAQYPEITPPTVQVSCVYPGADATVLQQTVAAPIEQQVNGVENMLYMSSQCSNDGTYTLNVTFKLGTDLDMAQVLVQNRVAQAMPTLPDVVKLTGVSVKKRSPSILLVVNLHSEDNPETGEPYFDQLYLSNYGTIQVRDELARLEGVGDVTLFGQQDYSMRVWVDPEKLASRNLSAGDVVAALREQNVQVAAGQIGQPPVPRGQDFQYTMTTEGRLVEAEQFGGIVIKTGEGGQVTYLRDVARMELGARSVTTLSRLDGKPSAGLAVYQQPGSNALETADRVREKMDELETRFPRGLKYSIVYDTTPFVEESVTEVFHTLRDAVILVAIVVLLFLQDWKAVMLPLIDVIVSLVGTCAVMLAMGFSLNNLTMFGLVLAIGIVVDDAIVVLENIERWLAKGLSVRDATIGAMTEITGPIVAITLVLSAVLLPSAFLSGITGQFYRQFALTISVSMIISAINAMTLTPARAAATFAHREGGHDGQAHHGEALPVWGVAILGGLLTWWLLGKLVPAQPGWPWWQDWGLQALFFVPGLVAGWLAARPVNRLLGGFFKLFNRGFDAVTRGYSHVIRWFLRLSVIVLLVYLGMLGLTAYGFMAVPKGFIPQQDKGYLIVSVQLPDSASLERTTDVTAQVEKIARETPGVKNIVSVPGLSVILNGNSSNFATLFLVLDPFPERHGDDLYADAIAARIRGRCYKEIQEARVGVFGAPPVDGLGSAGGFKLMLQDRGDVGLGALEEVGDNLAAAGARQPGLIGVNNGFRANTPQLYADVDRIKCKTLEVDLTDLFNTLQVFLGGYYVNDFNRFGRTWQVNVQAEARFRVDPESVGKFKVRNRKGEMVLLETVVNVRDSSGPVMVTRYNTYPAATITGGSVPGMSSGDVIRVMEREAQATLPESMTVEWTELTLLEKQANQTRTLRDLMGNPLTAFGLAVVLVYLILAAQYESWALPLTVILVVPMCMLSAIIGVVIAGMDINIFVQIGFVVLIGLASKNAILVVEFAKERQAAGATRLEATVEGASTRLRPIIMTSFAFILGVVPLVVSTGAGAEMRRTLGTAVFAGMLGVTVFGIFLTPVFYYAVMGLVEKRHRARSVKPSPPQTAHRGGSASGTASPPPTRSEHGPTSS